MVFIYVLKCSQGKYYVGKTTNPNYRLDSHFSEGGSAWTKKYNPISLYELIPDQTDHDEQRVTQEYMSKYGIDNVRGGPWCQINISESISGIEHILRSNSDKCYTCGSTDHYTERCPNKKKTDSVPKKKSTTLSKCNRCHRIGHNEETCYAKTYENGKNIREILFWSCEYCGKEFDSKRGCVFHENVHCIKRKLNRSFDAAHSLNSELYFSSDEEYSDEEEIQCYRCGRNGHYASNCFAKKHINGYFL